MSRRSSLKRDISTVTYTLMCACIRGSFDLFFRSTSLPQSHFVESSSPIMWIAKCIELPKTVNAAQVIKKWFQPYNNGIDESDKDCPKPE
jgi:hypothetical protein